jgi:putative transposase
MKLLIESGLELDRTAQLGCARHARNAQRTAYRNGYYSRDLESGFGLIRDLRVPRLRVGSRSRSLEQHLFERYHRRRPEVERFVRTLFFAGVSTRAVGEVLEILLGFSPSATAVSRMVAALDKEVKTYHARPLEDEYVYLFFDGLTVTLKEAPGAKRRLVLVAYGITKEGKRRLIDFRVAQSESQAEWDRFLRSLLERGLIGRRLKLITTDGGQGLRAAVKDCFPDAPLQLCWAHKLRNVAGYLHRANEAACLAGARKLYLASTRQEALALWKEWKATWEALEPKAVACLQRDLQALLTFLSQDACPKEHRRLVRTTNYIERLIRELRRRTRPMGAFADKMSCERLFFGVIRRLDNRWKDRKPLPGFTQKT